MSNNEYLWSAYIDLGGAASNLSSAGLELMSTRVRGLQSEVQEIIYCNRGGDDE